MSTSFHRLNECNVHDTHGLQKRPHRLPCCYKAFPCAKHKRIKKLQPKHRKKFQHFLFLKKYRREKRTEIWTKQFNPFLNRQKVQLWIDDRSSTQQQKISYTIPKKREAAATYFHRWNKLCKKIDFFMARKRSRGSWLKHFKNKHIFLINPGIARFAFVILSFSVFFSDLTFIHLHHLQGIPNYLQFNLRPAFTPRFNQILHETKRSWEEI